MRKVFRLLGVIVAIGFVGAQFAGPRKTNPPINRARTFQAQTQPPPEIAAVLGRACRDCHSNETRWPWYSNVAPVSWFVINHVNHGRSHLNFSDWTGWRHGSKADLPQALEAICEQVSSGHMPLPSYTLMHSDARLSPGDARVICEWTEGERQRLAELSNANSLAETSSGKIEGPLFSGPPMREEKAPEPVRGRRQNSFPRR